MAEEVRGRYHRKRRVSRHRSWYLEGIPIDFRLGNRRVPGYHTSMQVSGIRDADRFVNMIHDTLRDNPRDPILLAINGYQPWLQDVLETCFDDRWLELSDLNRELQFEDTVKFPERSNKRNKRIPWSFLVDMMNIPEVYWWTFGKTPPDDDRFEDIDNYRSRIATWACGLGACRFDERVPVIIIFTQPIDRAENVVQDLLFPHFYEDDEYDMPRRDEEGVCWTFLRLYWLLTDWQNIIREVERELEEAELNSRGRTFPVKLRTRTMHKQVDRIYELKEYMRFHSRSFKKLLKLKDSMHKSDDDDRDPVWDEMDDCVEDLDQYDYYLDTLKERFLNLIELEFNIENANQSDYSRFLSIIAALYLPVSYLASIFGISTFTGSPVLYAWLCIPLLVFSLAFTIVFPWAVRRFQKSYYPLARQHVKLPQDSFTMLGDELPDSADVPRNINIIRDASRHRRREKGLRRARSRSEIRRSREREKEKERGRWAGEVRRSRSMRRAEDKV